MNSEREENFLKSDNKLSVIQLLREMQVMEMQAMRTVVNTRSTSNWAMLLTGIFGPYVKQYSTAAQGNRDRRALEADRRREKEFYEIVDDYIEEA